MRDLQIMPELVQNVSDLYAVRFGISRDATWRLAKLAEEMGG